LAHPVEVLRYLDIRMQELTGDWILAVQRHRHMLKGVGSRSVVRVNRHVIFSARCRRRRPILRHQHSTAAAILRNQRQGQYVNFCGTMFQRQLGRRLIILFYTIEFVAVDMGIRRKFSWWDKASSPKCDLILSSPSAVSFYCIVFFRFHTTRPTLIHLK